MFNLIAVWNIFLKMLMVNETIPTDQIIPIDQVDQVIPIDQIDQVIQELIDFINNLNSIYEGKNVPFCYPGTYLDEDLKYFISEIIRKNPNMIGCHTHDDKDGKYIGEGGFDDFQKMERDAIRWIADIIGDITADGYFCSGGTEGNIMGMWIAREYLTNLIKDRIINDILGHIDMSGLDDTHINKIRSNISKKDIEENISDIKEYLEVINEARIKFRDDIKNIHITAIVPKTIHYSVLKAFDILGIVDFVFVKNTNDLIIDMNDLRKVIDKKVEEGTTSFIIAATAGICISGGIDPITEISDMIDEYYEKDEHPDFYFHVDAAFAGFTVPFLTNEVQIGFKNKNVKSIVIDGHKMGLAPYPSGIFMCKKDYQTHITRDVSYIRGGHDNTISGSRSAIGPISSWYLFKKYGYDGYRKLAQDCIDHRDKLVRLLTERDIPGVTILKCDPYVNFMPVIISVKDGKIPTELTEGVLRDYQMRSDTFMINGEMKNVYKVCIMRHTFNHIEQFVDDLETAITSWHNLHPID